MTMIYEGEWTGKMVTELKFHLADSYRQYTICVHGFQRSKLTIDELIVKGLSLNQNLKVYNIISLFPQEVEFLIKLALFHLWLLIIDKMCRNTNTHACTHTHTHTHCVCVCVCVYMHVCLCVTHLFGRSTMDYNCGLEISGILHATVDIYFRVFTDEHGPFCVCVWTVKYI